MRSYAGTVVSSKVGVRRHHVVPNQKGQSEAGRQNDIVKETGSIRGQEERMTKLKKALSKDMDTEVGMKRYHSCSR